MHVFNLPKWELNSFNKHLSVERLLCARHRGKSWNIGISKNKKKGLPIPEPSIPLRVCTLSWIQGLMTWKEQLKVSSLQLSTRCICPLKSSHYDTRLDSLFLELHRGDSASQRPHWLQASGSLWQGYFGPEGRVRVAQRNFTHGAASLGCVLE